MPLKIETEVEVFNPNADQFRVMYVLKDGQLIETENSPGFES